MGAAQPSARRTAITEGRFDKEIVAVGDFWIDEGPRETSLEKMAGLKPLARAAGSPPRVASQISDGAGRHAARLGVGGRRNTD